MNAPLPTPNRDFQRTTAPQRAPHATMDHIHNLTGQGRRDELLAYLRDTIVQYPNDIYLYMSAATTYTKLGDMERKNGDFDKADEHYNASLQYAFAGLQLNSNDVRLLTQAGKNYRLLGEYETSESFYRHAARVNDNDKHTWTAMGDLFHQWAEDEDADCDTDDRKNLYHDAAACYGRALRLDPHNGVALDALSRLAAKGYQPTGAEYDIDNQALVLIRNSGGKKPQDLPVPTPFPALDSL